MRVFMKRWKNNDWEEKEEKEASDFLASEKEIYLQYFAHNKAMFYDDDNGTVTLDAFSMPNG